MTFTGTQRVTYPAACLTSTCDKLNQSLQQMAGQMADAGITSYTCAAGSTRTCTCSATFAGATTSGSGTYSAVGGVLTEGTGGSMETSNYCVQGNALTVTPRGSADGDAGMVVSGGVGAVLEKLP